jgi:4-hydroxybenzoate polyprenyltransferase
MGKLLFAILKTARPRQWLKNVAIFTTILFTGKFFVPSIFQTTCWAFIAFCFLSSSGYIINDILDAPKDRKHPFKKFRPVASGTLPVPIAFLTSGAFFIIGISIASSISKPFLVLSIVFIALQYTYSLLLKHVAVIDILAITAAYFIRVYAGEAATGYHISIWLSLAALSLALFLAVGKRRAEMTLLQGYQGMLPKDTRASLSHYSERLLDTYTAMFANSTFITYVYYTFLERPLSIGVIFRNYMEFTPTVADRKWMMVTIPFVLYGIMRYMQLIYEGKGESPEQVLTTDIPLLTTVIIWTISVLVVIYGIGG